MKIFSKKRKRRKVYRRREDSKYIKKFQSMVRKFQDENSLKNIFMLYVFIPTIMIFVFECLGYKSITGGFEFLYKYPIAYLCNVLIISTSFSIAMLFKRRICVIITISFVWIFCAFTNFILLCNRVTPLTGNDLVLITDMFSIFTKYMNLFETICIVILIVVIIYGIVYGFLKSPIVPHKINYVKAVLFIIFTCMLTFGSINLGWRTGGVETQFHELSKSYKKNGFLYCFLNSLIDTGISKPKHYSQEAIETLVDEENTKDKEDTKKEETVKSDKDPNIIIVQLETFFDVRKLKNVTFSKNPIPNFSYYMEKGGSGEFSVPVVGAGTVNTEFEVLTGMNIDDFGAGEYPYKTILTKTTCETISYNLSSYGYSSHAIHDHVGSFYGRNEVYKNMGFNTFTSVEYMWPTSYTITNWAKDIVLTDEIKKALDSTESADFVYAVSVQGHGKYPSDREAEYEHHITLKSSVYSDEYLNQLTYYVNQVYEMDQFVGQFVKSLEKRNENTILMMYGDHLPSFDIDEDDLTKGNIYQTEYFIWNNMGLKFPKKDIEAYESSSIILKALNIKDGVINSYHQKYKKEMEENKITQEQYLTGLKDLEYDILYGDKICYDGINPYSPTDMKMGIDPIEIKRVIEKDDGIYVLGDNFTIYSKVEINGKSYETIYVNAHKLIVKDVDLEPGDEVVVWQRSLSSSNTYIFMQNVLDATGNNSNSIRMEVK